MTGRARRPRPPLGRVAGILIVASGAFAGGYIAGHRATFAQGMQFLTAETQGNLAQRIEALARIRTGDVNGAIASLEEAVDTAALTLPQGRAWPDLNPDLQFVLQVAKAYRSRYPASPAPPELTALYDSIPMPEVRYCSPAMQQLLGGGAGGDDRNAPDPAIPGERN